MPELPEVETIRRDLSRVLRGKKLAAVAVHRRKVVRGSLSQFRRRLVGNAITGVARRGKLLIFSLRGGQFLLVHLKMTGQLIYVAGRRRVEGGHAFPPPGEAVPNRQTRVVLRFVDGSALYFNDLRLFGFMQVTDAAGRARAEAQFGIEPLAPSFTREALAGVLRRRTAPLKAVLIDQRRVAGLGNIYADEVCFAAGVRPARRAGRISQAQVERLRNATIRVLRRAIRHRGTTFGTYRDGRGARGNFMRLLGVYGRAGQRCRRCRRGIIQKVKIAGRGTHYCPVCQV